MELPSSISEGGGRAPMPNSSFLSLLFSSDPGWRKRPTSLRRAVYVLSPLSPVLISSGNNLTDTPRYCSSFGHPMANQVDT